MSGLDSLLNSADKLAATVNHGANTLNSFGNSAQKGAVALGKLTTADDTYRQVDASGTRAADREQTYAINDRATLQRAQIATGQAPYAQYTPGIVPSGMFGGSTDMGAQTSAPGQFQNQGQFQGGQAAPTVNDQLAARRRMVSEIALATKTSGAESAQHVENALQAAKAMTWSDGKVHVPLGSVEYDGPTNSRGDTKTATIQFKRGGRDCVYDSPQDAVQDAAKVISRQTGGHGISFSAPSVSAPAMSTEQTALKEACGRAIVDAAKAQKSGQDFKCDNLPTQNGLVVFPAGQYPTGQFTDKGMPITVNFKEPMPVAPEGVADFIKIHLQNASLAAAPAAPAPAVTAPAPVVAAPAPSPAPAPVAPAPAAPAAPAVTTAAVKDHSGESQKQLNQQAQAIAEKLGLGTGQKPGVVVDGHADVANLDGVNGPATTKSVKAMQHALGLREDGKITKELLAELDKPERLAAVQKALHPEQAQAVAPVKQPVQQFATPTEVAHLTGQPAPAPAAPSAADLANATPAPMAATPAPAPGALAGTPAPMAATPVPTPGALAGTPAPMAATPVVPSAPREVADSAAKHNFLTAVASTMGFGGGLTDQQIISKVEETSRGKPGAEAITVDGKLDVRELASMAQKLDTLPSTDFKQINALKSATAALVAEEHLTKTASGTYEPQAPTFPGANGGAAKVAAR